MPWRRSLGSSGGSGTVALHANGCAIRTHKVRVQKYSSDARFTPKMDIFKQTILNTAYIKTLEIFPSARESLSVQNSASRIVKNQCCLRCS